MVGQAFSFNGTSRVSAPTTGLPTGNSNRTLDLWVKVNNFVAEEAFFAGYGGFESFDQTYQLGTSGNILHFSQWGQAVFGPALQTGRWYHVAVTNVGASVTLYLDGAAVASGDLSINTPSGTQLFVGSLPGDTLRRLDGLIDEVEIYNRALGRDEIAAIFEAGSAGKCKVTTIQIDIKPGSFPNSINPKSKGKIPVAILSTEVFDAPQVVNKVSLTFGPTGDEASLAFCNHRGEDVNGDGLKDLVCHFYTEHTEFLCGDTEGILKGKMMDGTRIVGTDSVRINPCK